MLLQFLKHLVSCPLTPNVDEIVSGNGSDKVLLYTIECLESLCGLG